MLGFGFDPPCEEANQKTRKEERGGEQEND
jgi:hypothetical protein